MQRLTLSAGLIAASIFMAVPVFAQTSSGNQGSSGAHQPTSSATPQKQKTQEDVTNSYLYKTPGGAYSSRGAQKQQTDGEDVTGNNNFPAASK